MAKRMADRNPPRRAGIMMCLMRLRLMRTPFLLIVLPSFWLKREDRNPTRKPTVRGTAGFQLVFPDELKAMAP